MENFQIDNNTGTFSSCAIMTFCFLLYGCSSGQIWILCGSKTAVWQIPVSSAHNPWPIPGRVLHKKIQPCRILSVFSPYYHPHTVFTVSQSGKELEPTRGVACGSLVGEHWEDPEPHRGPGKQTDSYSTENVSLEKTKGIPLLTDLGKESIHFSG